MNMKRLISVVLVVVLVMSCDAFVCGATDTLENFEPTATYSFMEEFDRGTTQLATALDTTVSYSQFVAAKVHAATNLTSVKVEDGVVKSTGNTNELSLSTKHPVPAFGEYVIDPDGNKASYMLDVDLVHNAIGSVNSAIYFGMRSTTQFKEVGGIAHPDLDADGIWFGIGHTYVGVGSKLNTTDTDIAYKWAIGNTFKTINHFRIYDNVKDNVIKYYTVEGSGTEETETLLATATIGTYDETADKTPVTYAVVVDGDTTSQTIYVNGEVSGEGMYYPQIYAYKMKTEVNHFSVTSAARAEGGLTSLKFGEDDIDLSIYDYTDIPVPVSGEIIVNAQAPYGVDYTISVLNNGEIDPTAVVANDGDTTVDVSDAISVIVDVNNPETDETYTFEFVNNNPGEVSFSPEAGVYETAREVTLTGSGKDGAEIYYTLDESSPADETNTSRVLYDGTGITVPFGSVTTIKAVEKIGEIYGDVATGEYDIRINVDEPVFSLTQDTYVTDKELALSVEGGADIYFTLDGSDPTDEANPSRALYTGVILLEAGESAAESYTVKAVAYRDDTYSDVVTKTYSIGITRESYVIDQTKITSAEDPDWNSTNEANTRSSFTTTTSDTGYFMVNRHATDGSVQTAMATLKHKAESADGSYSIEMNVRGASADTGNKGINVYLRKSTDGINVNSDLVVTTWPILMLQKGKLGLRINNWGSSASTFMEIAGFLDGDSHVKIVDSITNNVVLIYEDNDLVAYAEISGNTFTLYSADGSQNISHTYSSIGTSAYPAIAITHMPVQVKNVRVTFNAAPILNFISSSLPSGEHEGEKTVALSQFNTGYTIWYTTDGSDPTDETNSARVSYLTDIPVVSDMILKAYATNGIEATDVFTWNYEVYPWQPEEVQFSLEGGEYPTARAITLTDSGKPGAEVYYTVDGSDPADENNTERILYAGEQISARLNAATIIKAVEKIGELYGPVVTQGYYTGSVSAPLMYYPAINADIVTDTDRYWTSINQINTKGFMLVDDGDGEMIGVVQNSGSPQTGLITIKNKMADTTKSYSVDFDMKGVVDFSAQTLRGVNVFLRNNQTSSYIDGYNGYGIDLQATQIGLRKSTPTFPDANKLVPIGGNINLGEMTHIKIVDDVENGITKVMADGRCIAVVTFSGNTATLSTIGGYSVSETYSATAIATAQKVSVGVANSPVLLDNLKLTVGREVAPDFLAAPMFSLEEGRHDSAINIDLTTAVPMSDIYYTVVNDEAVESDPTDTENPDRIRFDGTISFPYSAAQPKLYKIKAVAYDAEGNASEVVTKIYTQGLVQRIIVADNPSVATGSDRNWNSPNSNSSTTAFKLDNETGWLVLTKSSGDGSYQHTTMSLKSTVNRDYKSYAIDFDMKLIEDDITNTFKSLYVVPRATTQTEDITAYSNLKFTFQATRMGLRTGNWGANAASMLTIPGMNLSTGGHITIIDDLEKNVFSIYVDDELKAICTVDEGVATLISVDTGESVTHTCSLPTSGYPTIASAHNAGLLDNITITMPCVRDIPVMLSHSADAYIGAQTVSLKTYYGLPIYYTLDGSDPTDSSNTARVLYTDPILVDIGTTTVKAAYYDGVNGVYGGNINHTYRIYTDASAVAADINQLADDSSLTTDQKRDIIYAIFAVTDFTISRDSYFKQLTNDTAWVESVAAVLAEMKAQKGENLVAADIKLAAYRAAVIAYFSDSITAADVNAVVTKANDNMQQYKMNIPLGNLNYADLPTSVQTWVVAKIKTAGTGLNCEQLYQAMKEAVVLSTVDSACSDPDYSTTIKNGILTKILNEETFLDDSQGVFKSWGGGSANQNSAINEVLRIASTETVSTILQLDGAVQRAVDYVISFGSSGGGGGPTSIAPSGGNDSMGVIPGTNVPVQPAVKPEIFPDAKVDAPWAYEALLALYEKGVVSGFEDGTFRSNSPVKREEFVTMLVLALGIYNPDATCDLTDANTGEWYDSYIASAVNAGIVTGIGDGKFGVGMEISREDMITMVFRALKVKGITLPSVEEAEQFSDDEDIAEYAREAMEQMQKADIINGMGDGRVAPGESSTRAQSAYVIYKMMIAANLL